MGIIERIQTLKKEKGAALLAHFYEDGEIQDVADYVGDSLYLAQQGQNLKNPVILLAGVVFMAESVKILSPEKTVLVPDLKAGCSLVSGAPFSEYLAWRQKFPNHIMVTYVNSSAEVKSISDVVCTSSNAIKIIESIPKDRGILFGPDKQLGKWLQKKTDRKMELWPGSCEVHVLFSAKNLFELKQQHPQALVLAHPECDDGVLSLSDVIGSTSLILKTALETKARTLIIATEDGIFHQIKKNRPDLELIQAPTSQGCVCNQCPYMKMNTLEKIEKALQSLKPQIQVSDLVAQKAVHSLDRMMKITNGQHVDWPKTFSNG